MLSAEIGETLLDIVVADITTLEVGAIVNAANRSLLGGGGVDGAIHRAAGPELLAECETLGGCDTGSAKITKRLPAEGQARHPCGRPGVARRRIERGGTARPAAIARRSISPPRTRLSSIAYPAISTGIYRFPADLAARIAVGTVASEIASAPRGIERVVFCCFSRRQRRASQDGVCGVGAGVAALARGHQTFGATSSRATQSSNPGFAAG